MFLSFVALILRVRLYFNHSLVITRIISELHDDEIKFIVKGERLVGSLSAVKARAPILGGNFAVWGGMFGAFDCTLAAIRQKEDPWNSILSGAMTGGCLAIRGSYFYFNPSKCRD